MKKTFAALAVAALFATAASAATFKAGTYTASAPGIHGAVTVEVTFTADKISAVKVVKQTETQGIGTLAVDQLRRRSSTPSRRRLTGSRAPRLLRTPSGRPLPTA